MIGLHGLRNRVVELTYKNKLAHLSSTLSVLPILREIYLEKKKEDAVVLSQGHAGLGLYVILELIYGINAQTLLDTHGIQPRRDLDHSIHVSTGSMGLGITVALGMAMAEPRRVYCVISDGECAEGSVWEVLRLARDFHNLVVYVNDNGQTAISLRDDNLSERLLAFLPTVRIRKTKLGLSFTEGVESHYHVITEKEFKEYEINGW